MSLSYGRHNVCASRKLCSSLLVSAMLVGWAVYSVAPTWGQSRKATAARKERHRQLRDDQAKRSARGKPGQGSSLDRLAGANLFKPLTDDEGPLTPAERREIQRFLRKHAPAIHRSLQKLRRRDPAAYLQRMQEAAPRLRQLRRIFARNPALGENIVRHSENLRRIHGARQAWGEEKLGAQERRDIRDAVRRMIAENLRIETEVLEDRALDIEQMREPLIEAEYQRLLSDDVDLAEEPPRVRKLVERLRAGEQAESGERLSDRLRRICVERIDREVASLRNRAARLRDNAPAEVDRRLMRFAGEDKSGANDFASPQPDVERKGGIKRDRENGQKTDDKPKRGGQPRKRP